MVHFGRHLLSGYHLRYCIELGQNLRHVLPHFKKTNSPLYWTVQSGQSAIMYYVGVIMGCEQKRPKNYILIQFANDFNFRPATSEFCQAPNFQCELLGV